MDMTRKKQVVKGPTSPVGVLNCDTGLKTFFGMSRSRLGLEG